MAIESTYINTVVKKAAGITSAALLGLSCYLPFSAQASTIPGEIILVAGQCPGGFLPADGSDVDLTAYPELAAVVQNSYGGGSQTGFVGLPGVQTPKLTNGFDYVYDETVSLSVDAESYLVKVFDPRGQRTVFEVMAPTTNGGGSNGDVKGPIKGPITGPIKGPIYQFPGITTRAQDDLSNPQNFVQYVRSFEEATQTRVETFAIRTQSGFALPNGEAVERGTEGSFWFGAYCTGNNGTCSNTNKAIETIDLSSLTAGDLDDQGRPASDSSSVAGDTSGSNADRNTVDADLPSDFAPFQPQYCVAVGGDTAPLVEVGLKYDPNMGEDGELTFARVDVSGLEYQELIGTGCFENGDLCLDKLAETNPGITRPNVTFRLVGENVCPAREVVAVTEYQDCSTIESSEPVQVRQLSWDEKQTRAFCTSIPNSVYHEDGFCESLGSGKAKISKRDCRLAGGENGDARNSQANSPICLPPESAFEMVSVTDSDDLKGSQCEVTTFAEEFYPGELKMSGVQIAQGIYDDSDKLAGTIPWGNDYEDFSQGGRDFTTANFAYITKRDEEGRPGFVAADLVDERTLILESRNFSADTFNYRVQAECGEGEDAFNVYYDPLIRNNGGSGGGFPY